MTEFFTNLIELIKKNFSVGPQQHKRAPRMRCRRGLCFYAKKVLAIAIILCIGAIVGTARWLWNLCMHRRHGKASLEATDAVFITGCDSGFGLLLATALAEEGVVVIAGCLTAEGVKRASALGPSASALRLDVTKESSIAACAQKVAARLASSGCTLRAIVNNAGIGTASLVDWTSLDEYRRIADVNLWGLIAVTRAFLPLLRASTCLSGKDSTTTTTFAATRRVINVSSIAGRLSLASTSAYAISKHGVEAFSDALRREVKAFGIDVVTISPGFFATQITDSTMQTARSRALWNKAPAEAKASYGAAFFDAHIAAFASIVNRLTDTAPGKVVNALYDAIRWRSPQPHVLVGRDAHMLWAPIAQLPAALTDAAVTADLFPVPPAGAIAQQFFF